MGVGLGPRVRVLLAARRRAAVDATVAVIANGGQIRVRPRVGRPQSPVKVTVSDSASVTVCSFGQSTRTEPPATQQRAVSLQA